MLSSFWQIKPLPAASTSSFDEPSKPLPPPPLPPVPPRIPSNEILDYRSKKFLQSLIKQCLKEVDVDIDLWCSTLLDIATQICRDVPFVLEIIDEADGLKRLDLHNVHHGIPERKIKSSTTTPTTTTTTASLSSSTLSLSSMSTSTSTSASLTTISPSTGVPIPTDPKPSPRSIEPTVRFRHPIRVRKEPYGKPSDSHYVPGTADDDDAIPSPTAVSTHPPFFPSASSSSLNTSIHKGPRELGGTIILHGPISDLQRLEPIALLLAYMACTIKLEMYLYLDSGVPAPTNPQKNTAQERYKSFGKSRAIWSWFKSGLSSPTSSIFNIDEQSSQLSPTDKMMSSHYFSDMINQIQNTVLSSSPDVAFPPPHLLLRLREEEREEAVIAAEEGNTNSGSSGTVAKRRPSFSNQELGAMWSGMLAFRNRFIPSRDQKISGNELIPPKKQNRISVDTKTGLGYLMTDSSSIAGVIRHQVNRNIFFPRKIYIAF